VSEPPRLDLGRYSTVLLDLDGTVYVDWKPLPGAVEFVAACEEAGAQVGFLTNLSLWPKGHCLDALEDMGIKVSPSRVLSAVDTLCHTVGRTLEGRNVACLTADHVARRLELAGFRTFGLIGGPDGAVDDIDGVVVAQCEYLDEAGISRAAALAGAGVPVFTTSTRGKMPTRRDDILSAGEILAAIRARVEFEPIDCGKPSQIFADAAGSLLDLTEPVLVVGDALDSDIALANNNGWDGLLIDSPFGEEPPPVAWPVPTFRAPSLAAALEGDLRAPVPSSTTR